MNLSITSGFQWIKKGLSQPSYEEFYKEARHRFDIRSLAMTRAARLPERVVQFYSGQVVLALEYLHHCGLLYRDLRPDSVLVDSRGYIRLRSLRFCCKLEEPEERTFTLCGAPDYRAPEILLGQGYSFPVDWWALGVFIFHISHGYLPFRAESQAMMYEDIILGRKRYESNRSLHLRMLLGNLLEVQPHLRFGADEVKNHPWFQNINWNSLFLKKSPSPSLDWLENQQIEDDSGQQFQAFDFNCNEEIIEDEFEDF